MGTLDYSLINVIEDTDDFDCNNPSINQLVSRSLYPTVLKQARTYKITMQGHRVGFCSISILGISLEHSDAPVAEAFEGTPSFAAVKLDYIAIDTRVQSRGIGTIVLKYIVSEARELCKVWPIRILVLDALRDKISWYIKRGFQMINSSDLDGNTPTVRLYIDLISCEDAKKIDEYNSSFY